MNRSLDRFLTTHTGSLPRPDDLIRMMFAREEGIPVDRAALAGRIRAAVAEVVRKQTDAGIAIPSDGEVSKPSYATYVKDRLDGFGGTSQSLTYRDLVDFPEMAKRVFGDPGRSRRKTPACTGPISVRDPAAAQADVLNLKAALGSAATGGCVHERRLARRHLALLPRRPLRQSRGVPVRHRGRHAPRVRDGRARRVHPAGRLPRPRHGPAHPVRRQEPRGVPDDGAAARRGARPRPREHPARAGAHAPVLGELRGAASPRRAAGRHPRHRLRGPAPGHLLRGGQSPPRARVESLRADRRCPRTRSSSRG